jgi:hypothetical protein
MMLIRNMTMFFLHVIKCIQLSNHGKLSELSVKHEKLKSFLSLEESALELPTFIPAQSSITLLHVAMVVSVSIFVKNPPNRVNRPFPNSL